MRSSQSHPSTGLRMMGKASSNLLVASTWAHSWTRVCRASCDAQEFRLRSCETPVHSPTAMSRRTSMWDLSLPLRMTWLALAPQTATSSLVGGTLSPRGSSTPTSRSAEAFVMSLTTVMPSRVERSYDLPMWARSSRRTSSNSAKASLSSPSICSTAMCADAGRVDSGRSA